MTEESGEEENDTRKVKVMKRKAKGALKSKGKVRSSTDFHNGLFMLQLLIQGSHSDWKTWKNGKAFSSQGKVREL